MPTLREFAAEQMPGINATVARSTAAAYDRALRLRVLPTLGDMDLANLSPAKIETAYAEWSGTTSTKADALAVLSRLMRRAVREGHRTANPVRDIEKPRTRQMDTLPRALTHEEQLRLFRVVPSKYHPLFGLMLYAGLRFGEAAGVMAGDVDLDSRLLTVKRQVDRSGSLAPTKSGRPRVVPIREELARLLRGALRGKSESDLVTTTPNGRPLHSSNLRRDLNWPVVRDTVRPGLRWHDLRHHAATAFLADGVPINSVQQFMGHSNVAVTSLYVVAGRTEALNALSLLNRGARMDKAGA